MMEHDELVQELEAHKDKNHATRRKYNLPDGTKVSGADVSAIVMNTFEMLNAADEKSAADFRNVDDLRERVNGYLTACVDSQSFPTWTGVCVYGLSRSRRGVNIYLSKHPDEIGAKYLSRVRDSLGDTLNRASLGWRVNAVAAIFELKNSFGYSDRTEIEIAAPSEDRQEMSADDIAARYI